MATMRKTEYPQVHEQPNKGEGITFLAENRTKVHPHGTAVRIQCSNNKNSK